MVGDGRIGLGSGCKVVPWWIPTSKWKNWDGTSPHTLLLLLLFGQFIFFLFWWNLCFQLAYKNWICSKLAQPFFWNGPYQLSCRRWKSGCIFTTTCNAGQLRLEILLITNKFAKNGMIYLITQCYLLIVIMIFFNKYTILSIINQN